MKRIKVLDLRVLWSKLLHVYYFIAVLVLIIGMVAYRTVNPEIFHEGAELVVFFSGFTLFCLYSFSIKPDRQNLLGFLGYDLEQGWFELQNVNRKAISERYQINDIEQLEIVKTAIYLNKVNKLIRSSEELEVKNSLELIRTRLLALDFEHNPYLLKAEGADGLYLILTIGSQTKCQNIKNKVIKQLGLEDVK